MTRMKTTRQRLGLLAAGFLLAATTAQAQLWANGGFELWTGACPTNTAPDSWTNYSTGLGPDEAGTCAGTVTAREGDSYMNLVWINSGLQEGASQSVTGLTIGKEYRITFYAVNSNGLYANPGDCAVEVHQNSLSIFSTGNLTPGGTWTPYSVTFTAVAPSETFAFRVVPGTSGTSGSAGVDEASVTEVVGVRDAMMHRVTAYPNPVMDGRLRIDQGDYIAADAWQGGYTVSNMLGQAVLQGEAAFSGGTAMVDVASLRPGQYVIALQTEIGPQVLRFMVR